MIFGEKFDNKNKNKTKSIIVVDIEEIKRQIYL